MDNSFEKFESEANAGPLVAGLPNWKSRELTGEYITKKKRPGMDIPFLVLTLLILMIGVIMVLSASFARGLYTTGTPLRVFSRQMLFAGSGIALMLLVSYVSTKTLSRWSFTMLGISILLLIIVLLVGERINGAKRWLGFNFDGVGGTLSFQPSEVAKLALILATSQWICIMGKAKMRTFKYGVAPFIAITAIIVGLLMMEPHISASIIVILLTAIMMFAGGTRIRWFVLAILALAAIAGSVFFMNSSEAPQQGALSSDGQVSDVQLVTGRIGYANDRINAWLEPEADPLGDGFQIRQSLYAVGSGGWLGQGLGQSRQKYMYLPEEHNDYIFAIVCEELGYIGAMLILMLFVLLIIRGFWLALNARDRYSALITTGITALLAIQVFINVAVVTNILPPTGVALPFFSSGGTALWIQLFQMGIVLAVSREIPSEASRKRV